MHRRMAKRGRATNEGLHAGGRVFFLCRLLRIVAHARLAPIALGSAPAALKSKPSWPTALYALLILYIYLLLRLNIRRPEIRLINILHVYYAVLHTLNRVPSVMLAALHRFRARAVTTLNINYVMVSRTLALTRIHSVLILFRSMRILLPFPSGLVL